MRHRSKRRPAASVGRVCSEHLASFKDLLADIVELHAELPYAGHPLAVRSGQSESKHTRNPFAPTPVSLDVLVLRGGSTGNIGAIAVTRERNGDRLESNGPDVPDILAVLHAWCTQVAEDRDQTPGSDYSVPGMIATLRSNLSWIVAQDWLLEFDTELRRIRTVLALAVGDNPMPAP